MQDKQRKEIVDSQGNAHKSTRDSKVKQFLKKYLTLKILCSILFNSLRSNPLLTLAN